MLIEHTNTKKKKTIFMNGYFSIVEKIPQELWLYTENGIESRLSARSRNTEAESFTSPEPTVQQMISGKHDENESQWKSMNVKENESPWKLKSIYLNWWISFFFPLWKETKFIKKKKKKC